MNEEVQKIIQLRQKTGCSLHDAKALVRHPHNFSIEEAEIVLWSLYAYGIDKAIDDYLKERENGKESIDI